MSDAPFHHSGPVTIDGVTYPHAEIREYRSQGGLRSWSGSLSFHANSQPTGFSPDLAQAGPVKLGLLDGRAGQAFLSMSFNGSVWTLDIQGTGPAPA
ncbi:hypothetical protein ACIPY6_02955 [Streptomyces sp. NPDC090054]|uniref:hypothetical protein n=1 Tax=Streptomyces sp. NPDC090054 TaxID=3365933 RepID=UPI003810911F